MSALLVAAMLTRAPMVELVEVCERSFVKDTATPACTPVLELYRRFLSVAAPGVKPDGVRVEVLQQPLVPGRVLLVSGWADGGHRRLERLVVRALDGALDVVSFVAAPASGEAERQVYDSVSLVRPEAFLALLKAREAVDGFAEALDRQRRPWQGVMGEALGERPTQAQVSALAMLLIAMLDQSALPKPLRTASDIPSGRVRARVEATAAARAGAGGGPSALEPFVVRGASARGMLWGGTDDNCLLRVELTLETGRFRLERQALACEPRFVE